MARLRVNFVVGCSRLKSLGRHIAAYLVQRENRPWYVAIGQPVVARRAKCATVTDNNLSSNRLERGAEVLHRF